MFTKIENELKVCQEERDSTIYVLEYSDIFIKLLREKMASTLPDMDDLALVQSFLEDVETMVREILKSVLIDAVVHKYRPSIIIAGLFSATIEIKFHQMLSAAKAASPSPLNTVAPDILRTICQVWERIVTDFFGDKALRHIDNFGRYVVLRQQKIFKQYGNMDGCINEIYNVTSSKMYDHEFFDQYEYYDECIDILNSKHK